MIYKGSLFFTCERPTFAHPVTGKRSNFNFSGTNRDAINLGYYIAGWSPDTSGVACWAHIRQLADTDSSP